MIKVYIVLTTAKAVTVTTMMMMRTNVTWHKSKNCENMQQSTVPLTQRKTATASDSEPGEYVGYRPEAKTSSGETPKTPRRTHHCLALTEPCDNAATTQKQMI